MTTPGGNPPGDYPGSNPSGTPNWGQPPAYGSQPGQPGYGQFPYGQPGPAGFGQPYGPGGTWGTNVPLPPRKKPKWPWIVGGVVFVVVALIATAVAVVVVTTKDRVTSADEVNVGDCIVVSGNSNDVKAKHADCSNTDQLSFYVASKEKGAATCDMPFSSLQFRDDDTLCLAPNFTQGECYQLPASDTSGSPSLTVLRHRGCGDTPDTDTVLVKITKRTDSQPDCSSDEYDDYFPLPNPVGYCRVPVR